MRPSPRSMRPRQAGFTLVELMIAVVLSMVIAIALAGMLISVNRTSAEITKDNAVIENGRFGAQILQADLSHVGFMAGYTPVYDDLTYGDVTTSAIPTDKPDPCLAVESWTPAHVRNLLAVPVQVYPAGTAGMPCSALNLTAVNSAPRYVQTGTDVVFVTHLAPCVATVGAIEQDCKDLANDVYFQNQNCYDTSAPLYHAYTAALGTNSILFTISASGTVTAPVTVTPSFALRKRDCAAPTVAVPAGVQGTATDRYKLVGNIYYVRSYSTTVGDGIPTLMRIPYRCTVAGTSCTGAPTFQSAEALIEGVERLRVELGLDTVSDSGNALLTGTPAALSANSLNLAVAWASATSRTSPTNRGDGLPDGDYVHCTGGTSCNHLELMNAVSAKIYMLMRSPQPTGGYTDAKTYRIGSAADAYDYAPNDRYKRHLFMQTVRFTNVSMRRETP